MEGRARNRSSKKEVAKRQAERNLHEQTKSTRRAVRTRRSGTSNVAELADGNAQEKIASERLAAVESMLALDGLA